MGKMLYDLAATQPNNSGERHGGGKYGEAVFRRMIELGFTPVCYYKASKWLNPNMMKLIDKYGIVLYDIETVPLDEIVKKENVSVLYSCLPTNREIAFTGCNVIGTIHGLRSVEVPYDNIFWEYRNKRLRSIIRFCLEKYLSLIGINWHKDDKFYQSLVDKKHFEFITVSNHSMASFKCFYPCFRNINIRVFYSPSTSSIVPVTDRKIYKKYFMLVSANRWEKNNLRAIKALDQLFSNGYLVDFYVCITGAKDANCYKYKIKNINRFFFTGYIDDFELEQLYHDAYALIYPSLNEGFGYPPIEAMRYGIPVLASPYSSIPEICQGAAMYFNPQSVEEIMNRILLIENEELYEYYSQRSLERYAVITAKQKKDLDSMIYYLYDKVGVSNNSEVSS